MMQFFEKIKKRLSLLSPRQRLYFIYTHQNAKDRFKWGVMANSEISYFSFQALQKRFPRIVFLKMQDEKAFLLNSIRPQDVVIGHVGETFLEACKRTQKTIAFYPWAGHEDRSTSLLFNCLAKEKELNYWNQAAAIILLTSEYNVREYIEKDQNFWHAEIQKVKREKPFRIVHQPLDLTFFKRIKWDYKTSNFLYIGNDAHMKCVPASKRLVEKVGKTLHLYGMDGRRLDHRNESQVLELTSQADFFIQPGMWEGQCVSILESAARGFIPLVSEETGYPYSHPYLLRYGDEDYNLKVIQKVLKTTPEERKELGDELHKKLVEDHNHNNWEKLTSVLCEEVERFFSK